jgi:hypothetical protein
MASDADTLEESETERAARKDLAKLLPKSQEERRASLERVRERMKWAYARQGELEL